MQGSAASFIKTEFFILKAHGDAAKVGSGIILTDVDYRNVLFRQRRIRVYFCDVHNVYYRVRRRIDDGSGDNAALELYRRQLCPGSGPSHFALMVEEDITGVEKDRWLQT